MAGLLEDEESSSSSEESTESVPSELGEDDDVGELSAMLDVHTRSLSASQAARRDSLRETSGLIDSVLKASRSHQKKKPSLGESESSSSTSPPKAELVMTAAEEMSLQLEMKDRAMSYWDVIDKSGNGDVDINEWTAGLLELGLGVTEADARSLFAKIDRDDSSFVEKQDWFTVCMVNFRNPELARIQRRIQARVRSGHREDHHREGSGLVTTLEEDSSMSDEDLSTLAAEMKAELYDQAKGLKQSVDKEQTLLEALATEATDSEDFAKVDNAPKWTPKEVAYYIDNLGHTGTYAQAIVDKNVTGHVLLNDMSQALLSTEIGVSPLHIGDILRAIEDLRKMHSVSLTDPYKDWSTLKEENTSLLSKIDALKEQMHQLDVERGELLLKMSELEGGGMYAGLIAPSATSSFLSEPTVPLREYERVCHEKIAMIRGTAAEIQSLRTAVRIYESDASSSALTPGGFHPIDSLVTAMGYKKH